VATTQVQNQQYIWTTIHYRCFDRNSTFL